jgi:hypothetical protein
MDVQRPTSRSLCHSAAADSIDQRAHDVRPARGACRHDAVRPLFLPVLVPAILLTDSDAPWKLPLHIDVSVKCLTGSDGDQVQSYGRTVPRRTDCDTFRRFE